MNASTMLITAAAISAFASATLAAEDHTQHQQPAPEAEDHAQHQQPAPETDEHAQHQQPAQKIDQHAEHQQPAQQPDEHAQHRQPAQQTDEHAQHEQPTQQTDEHAGHHQHDQHAAHQAPVADGPTESELAHIPPDPPQHVMGDMSSERMTELMQMEDDAPYSMLLLDQFEWQKRNGEDALAWELDAWYGDDYNKIWFETEGERVDSEEEGRYEVMWDHIITPWWSLQTGLRQDFGPGPTRNWLDLGIQGMSPYFFDIDAALYIGEQGRTSARFSAEYDMLITQRLILQPEVELRLFGKDDPENGIGSGLSDAEVGLRLRYEIRREIAPYLGLHWERKFGRTATFARDEGEDDNDLSVVAGLHVWF